MTGYMEPEVQEKENLKKIADVPKTAGCMGKAAIKRI